MSSADDALHPEQTGVHSEPAAVRPLRSFLWSVRRELWESRAVTVAPLAVAGFVFLASLINLLRLPGRFERLATLSPAEGHLLVARPFSMAPAPIMLTALLVGLFYALDALHGERRDRSLLFWRSLPVSDTTAVLAKASIPLAVLPVFALVLSWVVFFALLAAATLILWGSGTGAAPLWREVRFVQEPIIMAYGLTVHALWFAPLYAWALLLSAWARRLPLLWFALPPVVLLVVEHIFGGAQLASLLRYRLGGAMQEAFVAFPKRTDPGLIEHLGQLDPGRFLSSPGLWLGLLVAAGLLAAAARLRRARETL